MSPASTLTPSRARLRRIPLSPRGPEQPAASRGRSAGPTEDRALYRCGCGHAFRADVTASVGCPRCGAGQPW